MNSTRNPSVRKALANAHEMAARYGVPVFTTGLTRDGSPTRQGWQKLPLGTNEVSSWRPGLALCALPAKAGFTVLDSDPRHGGGLEVMLRELGADFPEVFCEYETRSGGRHLWISSLGVDRSINLLPGLDILGKDTLCFIAPTVRAAKHDPIRRAYGTGEFYVFDPGPSAAARRWVTGKANARKRKPPDPRKPDISIPIDLAALAETGIKPGEQHVVLLRALHMLAMHGTPRWLAEQWYNLVVSQSELSGEPWTAGDFAEMWEGEEIGLAAAVTAEIQKRKVRREADRAEAEEAAREDPFEVADWDAIEEEERIPFGADGVLFESGCSWISGAPGAGKTTLGYWVLLMRVRAGAVAVVLENEMGERQAKAKLMALGATESELAGIHYVRTADGSVPDLVRLGPALERAVTGLGANVVLYDALASYLQASGLKENDAEVRRWYDAAVRPHTAAGRAVLILDHVGYGDAGRARGSSDKPAAGDVILVLETTEPFKRGTDGLVRLKCSKDRTGQVHHSAIDIAVRSGADGSIVLKPGEWADVEGDFQPQRVRVKDADISDEILELAESRPFQLTKTRIRDLVAESIKAGKDRVAKVFDDLADRNLIACEKAARIEAGTSKVRERWGLGSGKLAIQDERN